MIFPLSVLDELDLQYLCVITGSNRSGKTLLAFELAEHYLKAGFRLVTNIPSVWADSPGYSLNDDGFIDTVVILDEGGVYIRTKESVYRMMLYKGKLNCRFIIPCIELPHEDISYSFLISPVLVFGDWLTVWVYQTRSIRDPQKVTTRPFLQFNRAALFGLYSTGSTSAHPSAILSWFDRLAQEKSDREGLGVVQLSDVARPGAGLGSELGSLAQLARTFGGSGSSSKRGLFSPKTQDRRRK